MPMTTYVGDTGTPFIFVATLIDGSHPDLTGFSNSNFILHLYNVSATPNVKACTGNWTVIDGPGGKVAYQPNASDLDTTGTWTTYFRIVFSNGPKTFTPDQIVVNPVF